VERAVQLHAHGPGSRAGDLRDLLRPRADEPGEQDDLSLCRCLLPLGILVLGLGSGAFMAVTMQYRWVLIPAGVLGIALGFVLYARERRRCVKLTCRMAGSRVTSVLLIAALLVVASAIVLDQFPEMASDLLMRLTEGAGRGQGAGHDMKGGARGVRPGEGDRRADDRAVNRAGFRASVKRQAE
jgi:hypothetical protein